MKITDKMRLDWLQKNNEHGCILLYKKGWDYLGRKKTVRQAIDAEIKLKRPGNGREGKA